MNGHTLRLPLTGGAGDGRTVALNEIGIAQRGRAALLAAAAPTASRPTTPAGPGRPVTDQWSMRAWVSIRLRVRIPQNSKPYR